MIDVMVNPAGTKELYLECLNRCFGDWGGNDMYRWCFERPVGSLSADIMILKKDGAILAGSSVTYRRAYICGTMADVAIMTGSWTLPEARNQGCFSRIIDESQRLADEKGAALLLAFVTHTNPSLKRLAAKGAALFETHYLVSGKNAETPQSGIDVSIISDTGVSLDRMFRSAADDRMDMNRLVYDRDEWEGQYLLRPERTIAVSIGETGLAIIEQKGVFDRMLALAPGSDSYGNCLRGLLRWSAGKGRRLFAFTTIPSHHADAMDLGFEHIPGFLTTMIGNSGSLRQIFPEFSSDEVPAAAEFYDANSAWYLGPWDLAAGDRM